MKKEKRINVRLDDELYKKIVAEIANIEKKTGISISISEFIRSKVKQCLTKDDIDIPDDKPVKKDKISERKVEYLK